MSVRCECGRFARYDAYNARWWCNRCERSVGQPNLQTGERKASKPVLLFQRKEA